MTSKTTFKDRLLWTLFSATAVAVAATLAQGLVAVAWERTTRRAPPKGIRLLLPAGRRAGKGAAGYLLSRGPLARALRG